MTDAADPFALARFVAAQAPVIADVRAELAAGRKRSHWMWFVFPQLAGLGASGMSARYAISGLDEARAYAAHPILGGRLGECARLVLAQHGQSARAIFGPTDEIKLCSSMTLFERAVPAEPAYAALLDAFYAGVRDEQTLRLLAAGRDPSLRSG